MNKTITVIGGDSRQLYAAEYLKDKEYKIKIFACEHGKYPENTKSSDSIDDAMKSDVIILPLPVSKNGSTLNSPLTSKEIKLKDIIDKITDSHYVFYGMGTQNFSKNVQAKAKYACDYFNIESLIYKNALLTSEGLLSIILDKLPTTVFGMKAAITGYGRIAGFTADKLLKLGADVSVFARNELQLLKAQTSGAKTYHNSDITETIGQFDIVINTVPSQVINKKAIENSNRNCIFIEAASAPYGIDSDACALYGRTLIKAFSLPGKTAPKSAGIIIGETIDKQLREVK